LSLSIISIFSPESEISMIASMDRIPFKVKGAKIY
jgi:hypothetical protein